MDQIVVSVEETQDQVQAVVNGEIPRWLNGSLIRVGPAKWDLKDGFTLNHWLDGCAMVVKFKIDDGSVTYTSRFVESDAYKKMMAHGKPVFTEFGTKAYQDPSKGFFARMVNSIVPSDLTDNDISNIYKVENEIYVATESCNIWRIDPDTLESKTKVNLDKLVGVNICSSHPQHSDVDGATYNIGASFMSGSMKYHVVKTPAGPTEKADLIEDEGQSRVLKGSKVLATIPSSYTGSFSYIHSFATTERFIVFLEQPLVVNGLKLATCTIKGKPLQECMQWKDTEPTRFHVIEKATGTVRKVKYHSEALYHFHTINAYEDGDFIVLDLVAYDNADVLSKYMLKRMRANEWDDKCPPVPRRFVLPLGQSAEEFEAGHNLVKLGNCEAKAERTDKGIIWLTSEQLGPPGFELPVINRHYSSRKHQYVYGSGVFERGQFANSICKLNSQTKSAEIWRDSSTAFPGEAMFLPRPGGSSEDDGLLLSVVLESDPEKPHYLLLVDAITMQEVARAELDRTKAQIPTTIHGIFVPNSH